MEKCDLKTWEEFEEVVRSKDRETSQLKQCDKVTCSTTPILYRGQSDSEWDLKTVLERTVKKEITVKSYLDLMLQAWAHSEKISKKWPKLQNEINDLNIDCIHSFPTARANTREIIKFMAHLRHHGFPSPLLDWTENPLIAAFFAFENIPDAAKKVAIYTFREKTGQISSTLNEESEPIAIEIGGNIPGIERHKKQESHYTLCTQQDAIDDFQNAIFASIDKDVNRRGIDIDDSDLGYIENVTCKYTIPVSERKTVLKLLQKNKIDSCFLFGETEDNRLSDCWNSILVDDIM